MGTASSFMEPRIRLNADIPRRLVKRSYEKIPPKLKLETVNCQWQASKQASRQVGRTRQAEVGRQAGPGRHRV